ncbi:MAG: ATP-binding cassette domain-containing protein, partial [Myxococcota bacterium]
MWGPLAWGIGVLFREHRSTQPLQVLRGVDLDVHRGTILGLLGPSSSGKSTLLRIVAGLLSISSGKVRVAGHDPRTQRRALHGRIGYVIRNGLSFNGHLSGYENLRFFAGLHGLPRKEQHHLILGLLGD